MGDRGNRTYEFTGETTEFDDILISKGIVTKEQALLAKGMGVEAVADVLVRDKLQAMGFFDQEAPSEPSKQERAAEASLDELDELEEDEDFDDEAFLAEYLRPPLVHTSIAPVLFPVPLHRPPISPRKCLPLSHAVGIERSALPK